MLAAVWVVFTGFFVPATLTGSRLCGACHASGQAYASWRKSPHQKVACMKCHGEPGLGGFVSDQLRVSHNIVRALAGDGSAATVVANDACTACHTRIVDDMIVRDKVRIDHREPQLAGWRCTDCHSSVGHRLQSPAKATKPTYDKCFACHRADGPADYLCSKCHISKIAVGRAPGPKAGSLDHRRQWRANHGQADLLACANCHTERFCKRCHSAALPHEPGWALSHADSPEAKMSGQCDDCHKGNFCKGCHGVTMPHPEPYYPKHAKEAAGGGAACLKCHKKSDCTECHTAHVEHPIVE